MSMAKYEILAVRLGLHNFVFNANSFSWISWICKTQIIPASSCRGDTYRFHSIILSRTPVSFKFVFHSMLTGFRNAIQSYNNSQSKRRRSAVLLQPFFFCTTYNRRSRSCHRNCLCWSDFFLFALNFLTLLLMYIDYYFHGMEVFHNCGIGWSKLALSTQVARDLTITDENWKLAESNYQDSVECQISVWDRITQNNTSCKWYDFVESCFAVVAQGDKKQTKNLFFSYIRDLFMPAFFRSQYRHFFLVSNVVWRRVCSTQK